MVLGSVGRARRRRSTSAAGTWGPPATSQPVERQPPSESRFRGRPRRRTPLRSRAAARRWPRRATLAWSRDTRPSPCLTVWPRHVDPGDLPGPLRSRSGELAARVGGSEKAASVGDSRTIAFFPRFAMTLSGACRVSGWCGRGTLRPARKPLRRRQGPSAVTIAGPPTIRGRSETCRPERPREAYADRHP